MSRKKSLLDTREGRAELAARVKDARTALDLRQEDLAAEARVSRTTLIDIEAGKLIPQSGTLQRILDVLGIDAEPNEDFDRDTRMWMGMVGGMLQALPPERRDRAGQAAVNAVAQELTGKSNVLGLTEDDVHVTPEGPRAGYALAAKRGRKKADEPHAE
ncbi:MULTISPECIES: helix-turn-helix transcriptional regulator [unclassified Microbacterium]|uniref:helix-turn-helix transcriptional regulator n=1 Tax=unclassified Microbacterium TaxID=2609290 RepID=UPI003428593E